MTTYVFISSAGTRGLLSGYVPYSKMKVGVEEAIKGLGFEQTVILRPGMISGERETPKAPVLEKVIGSLGRVSSWLQDSIGMYFPLMSDLDMELTLLVRSGSEDHWEGCGGGCEACAGGEGSL